MVCTLECERGVPSMTQWVTCRNSLQAASNNNPQMSFIKLRRLTKRSAEFPGEEGEGAVEEAYPLPRDIDADQAQKILNEKNAATHDLLRAIKMEEARESGDVFKQKPFKWTEDRDEELHKDIANALHDFLHEKLMKELEADRLSHHRHMEVADEGERPNENTRNTLQQDRIGGGFEDVQRGIPVKEAKRYGSFIRDAMEREPPANEPREEINTNQRKRYGGFFEYSKRHYPENGMNFMRDTELPGASKKEQKRYGGFIRESDDEKLGEQRRGNEQLQKRYGGFIRSNNGGITFNERQRNKGFYGLQKHSAPENGQNNVDDKVKFEKGSTPFFRQGELHPSDFYMDGDHEGGPPELQKRYGSFLRFRKFPNSESNEEEIQWPSFRSLQGYRK
uniref:Uncharacterized protein n=1 Tax=Eptatretus burgeri TaxID=7764 RepID=A0A8C4Q1X2_EPTBU